MGEDDASGWGGHGVNGALQDREMGWGGVQDVGLCIHGGWGGVGEYPSRVSVDDYSIIIEVLERLL